MLCRIYSTICACLITISIFPQKQIKETFPGFGKITLRKDTDGVYRSAVKDRTIGPITLSNGTATKDGDIVEITYTDAQIADQTFKVVFSKEPTALSAGMSGQVDIVGRVESEEGNRITIAGVTLEKSQLLFNFSAQDVILEGIINKFGLSFIGRFKASAGEKKLIFDASIQDTPQAYYPFKHISADIPDFLKDIQLERVRVGVRAGAAFGQTDEQDDRDNKDQSQGTAISQEEAATRDEHKSPLFGRLYIEGDVANLPIIEQKLKALVEFGMRGDTPQATLLLSLPEGWKISNLLGMLPLQAPKDFATALNSINVDEARLIATTQESFEYQRVSYARGFNAYAMISLPQKGTNRFTDILRNVYSDLGVNPDDISMELIGNFNPFSSSFSIEAVSQLSNLGFSIGGFDFQDVGVGIVVSGEPKKAAFELVGECKLQPPEQKSPLTFNMGISFETPSQLGGYLSMAGIWNDPLGIKGISVGNLGAKANYSLSQAAATGGIAALIPAEAGLTGDAEIQFTDDTRTKADFALKSGTDVTGWAFDASIEDAPNLPEVATFIAKQLRQDTDIPTDNIVPIDVNKARLQFVPFPTKIGEIKIEQGLASELDIELLGKRGKLYLAANIFKDMGITAKGSLDPIHLKGLHITGAGDSEKPRFDYQLNAQNQNAILKGNIYVGPKGAPIVQSTSNVEFSTDTASFGFKGKIGPFNACVTGGIRDFKSDDPNAEITIDLESDFIHTITKFINEAHSEISDAIDKLKSTFKNKEQALSDKRKKLKKKQEKMDSLSRKEFLLNNAKKKIEKKKEEIVRRKQAERERRGGGTIIRR